LTKKLQLFVHLWTFVCTELTTASETLHASLFVVNSIQIGCLGGAAVRRLTRDRKVAGLSPGLGAIKSTNKV